MVKVTRLIGGLGRINKNWLWLEVYKIDILHNEYSMKVSRTIVQYGRSKIGIVEESQSTTSHIHQQSLFPPRSRPTKWSMIL